MMSSRHGRRMVAVGVGLLSTAVLATAMATAESGGSDRVHHKPRPTTTTSSPWTTTTTPWTTTTTTAPTTSTTAPLPAAPGVPDTLRISSSPYAGFQFCVGGHPVVDSQSGLLAASPTPGSSGGTTLDPYPGLVGTFEIALADQDAFHRQSTAIESNGHTFAYQVPQGLLPNGEYRWRIRAEDGSAVSNWSPWCSFTVSISSSATDR